ncbi:S23 ribosomal protein [Owenweeksia hongkongensis DSM 17368]|uniref:S23 ribosomal protein n=2 Tax=Owenweeksia TaxID=267986 RepID=G8R340_OWEHD|nr:four helix bundle protein [Owenweeksia hongkongensis]AEV34065.1 S23 ribosomal protein [Owenweeksia hongkongensis DSM 17368]
MGTFKDLTAYSKAFDTSMEIFEKTKRFPKEEVYSLTDQVRRSSRSVCVNLGEGYRKRMYQKHFMAKVSDADMENTETSIWLDFALACKYLDEDSHSRLQVYNGEVGKLLGHMLKYPEKYGAK